MTDECGQDWTVNSLRTFVTSLLKAHDERYEQRFEDQRVHFNAMLDAHRDVASAALASAEKAVSKAEAASEKRFEGVNEFRAAMADQQRTFMPRVETEIKMSSFEDKIASLTLRLDKTEARGNGFRESWGYIVGAIGFLATVGSAIYALFMKE